MEPLDFNWKIDSPACIMIAGMTSSGKTELTKKLLQRRNEIFDTPVKRVLWCFTERQEKLEKDLKQCIPNIDFHEGLPEDFENPDPSQHMVMVLDDLIHECKNKNMQRVFVRGSHHNNLSVVYLTQNAFEPGQRTISLQCKYICLLKNPRDNAQYQYLGRAMNRGKNCPALDMAYKDASNTPYGYIVLDFSQKQNDLLRVRNSLFPENMTVYFKKN